MEIRGKKVNMNQNFGSKLQFKHYLFMGLALFALILLFSSWKSVNPGEEGFIYRPYTGGIDTTEVLSEGMYVIAPWNNLIVYNVRQQSSTYSGNFLDKNGMTTIITMAVNYRATKGKTSHLHLEYGKNYFEVLIDPKVKGTIKDVIGRYTYEEVYSSKREQLATEMKDILTEELASKYITIDFVTIADVDLPDGVKSEIENKETQKQRNKTSELKKIEQENLANAKIETARGDSAKLVIEANAEARAIEIIQSQLMKSPQYIEYMKAQRWDGKLPTYYGNGSGMLFNIK